MHFFHLLFLSFSFEGSQGCGGRVRKVRALLEGGAGNDGTAEISLTFQSKDCSCQRPPITYAFMQETTQRGRRWKDFTNFDLLPALTTEFVQTVAHSQQIVPNQQANLQLPDPKSESPHKTFS